ncbi:MAG: hypothetical protein K2G36_10230 [Ruminococcus sp.]|nr:hypothetical protein [Ruminococcus sp.]
MNKINYTDNFKKIITFYLFECPVEDVSKRGKTFKQIGWKGSSRLRMLERLLKNCTSINEENWIICDKSEVENKLNNVNGLYYIVCSKSKSGIKSIIYAIRNSFAHGSFEVKNIDGYNIYYLENHHKGHLCAKIVIEEDSLLEWIRIIKTNPEYLTKKAKYKKEKEKRIKNKQTK